ncbi:unnamed protein product [Adineta ricciae]|uniref:Aminopeptidase n=1 Tax=Adineta ricciae TaxID=249248 RepID=A0A815ZRB8_ADIRI|nr:unnamed protein product [Adineta ricciae]
MAEHITKKSFECLPATVIPIHYDITIRPFLDKFTFNGYATLDLQVKKSTNTMILYAAELKVDNVKLKLNANGKFENSSFNFQQKCDLKDELKGTIEMDEEHERMKISFVENLQEGNYQLSFDFVGMINDQMRGFYRNKYITRDGNEVQYGASTQFEPTDCRRAFPCWDEPNFKATFDITLITPKNLQAISNMPIKSESDFPSDKHWKITKFERTPIMSTYLVAYVVVGKSEHGRFALEFASKVLPFYAEYFDIKYPIAKADLIAISNFPFGAMENWGLITYRETALLIDPQFSSMNARQRVVMVVAHELAHQWFGNLVTMNWWTDLWLNEGFAKWIQHLAVDKFHPEFYIWTQFAADIFATFLIPDALKSSHPVEIPIEHPAEINQSFDKISYFKGASIIRMLHDYIGDEAFRKGLQSYLKKYSYKNTITEDLWSHLTEASGEPVKEVMSLWTRQIGYPFVTVTEKQQSNNTRILQLTQKRFIIDGSIDHKNLQWKIPITFVTKLNPTSIVKKILMDKPEITITLENISEDDWIKLNYNSIGLYRVKYESKTLAHLEEPIVSKILSPQDRLIIQDDSAALCNAGHQSFVDYLKLLLSSYKEEDDFTVWKSILLTIRNLLSLIEYTDYYGDFKKYCLNFFSSINEKLGWDGKPNEDPLIVMLRPRILIIMGSAGHPEIINEARRRFKYHINGNLIDPNIREAVYIIVSMYGDENILEELQQLHKIADMTEEKNNAEKQDLYMGVAGCAVNCVGRDIVWKYLKKNWIPLVECFGEKNHSLMKFVELCLSDFADENIANEIKLFFDSVNTPVVTRAVKQVVETICMRAKILQRDSKMIKEYLKQH